MTAWIDNDPALERAVDEAAAALLCCLAKNATDASRKMMGERLLAVVGLRDGVVGKKYVKARVLREALEAVSDRSLAIFVEEFTFRIRQRISPRVAAQVAEAVEHDLAQMVEASIPTTH